jgi:MtN3 and saliva related transmembrane protein
MDIWPLIGTLGVVFTSIQLFPQIYKSLKTKQVRDLSLGLCIIVASGSLTWLIYGIHLCDGPIIIANSLNFCGAAILFVLKIRE